MWEAAPDYKEEPTGAPKMALTPLAGYEFEGISGDALTLQVDR
jgi:hypothetical protein